jgi:hypothetical protein
MSIKKDIKKLSEEEADKYFICKFNELADEKEKLGFTKFAKMCRENIERIRNNKDLIEFEEISQVSKGERKKHVGISGRYAGWFDELADKKGKRGNVEFEKIFQKRAERLRDYSKFLWVWDKGYNELLED